MKLPELYGDWRIIAGVVLILLGTGNWLVGLRGIVQYRQLGVAAPYPNAELYRNFDELDARTDGAVLAPLNQEERTVSYTAAQMDFYHAVYLTGCVLFSLGLLVTLMAFVAVIRNDAREAMRQDFGITPRRNMAKRFELLTPAKINLFLRIVGRRPDGYHELDSLFLPISLFDRIAIETDAAAISAVSLRCNWREMPLDGRNLAVQAAELFVAHAGLRMRVAIDLHKEIPAGAGLGGGSSDAGAVLRALASMHGAGPAALAALALKIGADVPFFLDPRPARVGGVGERITYLEGDFTLHLTIGVPPVLVPTAEIYRNLERRQWSGPGPAILPSPLDASRMGRELLVNDLEAVAAARYPQIGELKTLLEDLGASGAGMSGSGGAVFGLFHSAGEAQRAAETAAARMPSARFVAARVLGSGGV